MPCYIRGMTRLAYVQRSDGDWLNEQMYSLARGCRLLGIEVRHFEFADLDRIDLARDTLVAGGVWEVRRALERLGAPPPNECSGLPPPALLPFYGRKIWAATMRDVRARTEADGPVFIKPLHRHKAFGGHVISGQFRDLIRTASFDDDFEVLCSEPVNFITEYRGFVNRGELIALRHYKGDFTRIVDGYIARQAVAAWHGPISYSIDFGLTDDGWTRVVEINDGFALGAYGLPAIQYARFVMDRWEEMVAA